MKVSELKPGMVVEWDPTGWWAIKETVLHLSLGYLWAASQDRDVFAHVVNITRAKRPVVVVECFVSRTNVAWTRLLSPELGVVMDSRQITDQAEVFSLLEEAVQHEKC